MKKDDIYKIWTDDLVNSLERSTEFEVKFNENQKKRMEFLIRRFGLDLVYDSIVYLVFDENKVDSALSEIMNRCARREEFEWSVR